MLYILYSRVVHVQNCSSSWCVEVVCQIQQLLKGQAAVIRITRRVHDNFFRHVRSTHTNTHVCISFKYCSIVC